MFSNTRSVLRLLKTVSTASVVLVCILGGTASAKSDGETQYIRLIWTNDTHGFFVPVWHAEFEELDSYEGTAATEGKVGGYANIKSLADELRKPYANSLFVDSGDTFDGSPVAQKTSGLAVIPILNAMEYFHPHNLRGALLYSKSPI